MSIRRFSDLEDKAFVSKDKFRCGGLSALPGIHRESWRTNV